MIVRMVVPSRLASAFNLVWISSGMSRSVSEYSKSAMFDYNMLGFDQQPIPTYRRQTDYSDTLLKARS